MDYVQQFIIELDSTKSEFTPGETVSGNVKMFSSKRVKVGKIRVELLGKADIRWSAYSPARPTKQVNIITIHL